MEKFKKVVYYETEADKHKLLRGFLIALFLGMFMGFIGGQLFHKWQYGDIMDKSPVKIRVLNDFHIWRFQFYWCNNYLGIYWMCDYKYWEQRQIWTYMTYKPIFQLGDKW